jgi:DNA-directed RNA polymerase subunit beta'
LEINDIRSIRIGLASPEQILEWSHGEVTKPETINYRRLRPEKDGLFCEAIFGPTKDWQCYCGKYKKVRFRGIKCDKCGVEVTHSRVRRERMGHIGLATPIAHIWYTRRSPSYLGLLLNVSQRNLDRVLYYAQYVITSVDENARERAVRRMDDEIENRIAEETKNLQVEIAMLQERRQRAKEAREQAKEALAEEIQTRRDRQVEEVMGKATRLEEILNQYRGDEAPDDLIFGPTRAVIANKGDMVTSDHIAKLRAEVQEELESIEDRLRLEQDRRERDLDKGGETLGKAVADLTPEIEERRKEREARLEELENAATRMRTALEQLLGKESPIVQSFEPTHDIIANPGEVITEDHLTKLQSIIEKVKSRIEDQPEEDAEQRVREMEKAYASDETIEERLGELAAQVEEVRNRVREETQEARDELMALRPRTLLNETDYRDLRERWPKVFEAAMGAEAVYDIVSKIDLHKMAEELRQEIRTTRSKQRRNKAIKRLQIVEALRKSGNRPEWMILKVLPVIPPALRPMVQLDGGRFATSDLNDLYRRVVNRNNRLKHLMKLQAPEVIIRNEKRMLQEAVDSLIDNSRRGKAVSLRGRRQLKSLSDMLKGKQGRFRRNLLGKRVDYSGRSVIVVGPHLKLHQCGLPKRMALELFRPFVMQKLVEYNHAINVKGAKRLIERETPEVWEVLEEVIKTRPVLLNRAPTLHRLGIQAFEPVLVEGSAIQIHPLVCSAFNADFDGDQMAVHVPLSEGAVREARELMLASRNLLRPANGEPEVGPSKDMVLGVYYLTLEQAGQKGEGMVFSTFEEVQLAHELGRADLHARITFLHQTARGHERLETTVGRVLFNATLPEELRFVNETLDKNGLRRLVGAGYRKLGLDGTGDLVDAIKDVGFKYAMLSGISIAIDDIRVPESKGDKLDAVNARVAQVEEQYRRGLITQNERYVKTVELWTEATEDITDEVESTLDPFGSLGLMARSGATKGGIQPIRQLAGMRGLMADASGRIIPLPIQSSFREGLTSLEYFISTHGQRKGLADTALRTADAGYLTRRLVDVAQHVMIQAEDCGTERSIPITRESCEATGESMAERIVGRYTASRIVDPATGEVLAEANTYIDDDLAETIEAADLPMVEVRSPLTCDLPFGLCVHCYGRDLGRGGIVKVGEAVGIIAAQSIGEPGTQLTLRTFHTGGVAGSSDITQGLPRVQELFEARNPRGQAVISQIGGIVEFEQDGEQRVVHVRDSRVHRIKHEVPGNYAVLVEPGATVEKGQVLAKRKGQEDIIAKADGRVSVGDRRIVVSFEETREREYEIPATARLRVAPGDRVKAGDMITEGAKNPHEILEILGREAVEDYLVTEIQKVYRSQGVIIHDKHIEVIVRQMLDRVRVLNGGDTELLPGQLITLYELGTINREVEERGGELAKVEPVLLGITKAALNTESFLSAASFQHTISVLAEAAIEGKIDDLRGLKESVIIGKLIPAGTGFAAEEEEAIEESDALEEAAEAQAFEDHLLGMDAAEELDALSAAFLAKGGDLSSLRGPEPEVDLTAEAEE